MARRRKAKETDLGISPVAGLAPSASTFIDVRDTRRLQTKTVGVCVVLTHFVYTDSRGMAHEGDLRDLAAYKNLKHPHTLCKLVNAAASATRVVVGATACAMHDLDQISVLELRDGSPWLD